MSDVKCPYCQHEQEINHDDGYGYEEDEGHEQECVNCGRNFGFTTATRFYYQAFCFKEEDHELKESEYTEGLYQCSKCNHYELRK